MSFEEGAWSEDGDVEAKRNDKGSIVVPKGNLTLHCSINQNIKN
jgi:hypothetical protein